MYFRTVSKNQLIGFLCIVFALTVVIGLALSENIQASSTTKKLPVYSVDTAEKKVAITFDAAWNDNDIDDMLQGWQTMIRAEQRVL